jgi:hypothetical protein
MLKQGIGLPTNSPSPTPTQQQPDQNNSVLIFTLIALGGLVLTLVGFVVFSGYKKKTRIKNP